MRNLTVATCAIMIVLAYPRETRAQHVSTTARTFSELEYGAPVMVSSGGARHVGQFRGVADTGVRIGTDNGAIRTFDPLVVDSIWRGENAARKGAVVGALSGLVLLGLGGYALDKATSEVGTEGALAGTLIGSGVGVGIGAIAGIVIGQGLRRWKLIHVRE